MVAARKSGAKRSFPQQHQRRIAMANGGDLDASTGDADGTQSGDDINIGVGELQECTISKSMDGVSHDVAGIDDLIVNAVISSAPVGDGGRDVLIGGAGADTEPSNGKLEVATADFPIVITNATPDTGDGVVDTADYVLWRKSSLGDAELDTDAAALAASVFDFKAAEESEAAGQLSKVKTFICPADVGTELASVTDLIIDPFNPLRDNSGVVDAADYQCGFCERAISGDNTDLSLSDVDKGPLPVSMAEYCLLL
jgi:hypothetical protein